jgi:proline dehydrogenase
VKNFLAKKMAFVRHFGKLRSSIKISLLSQNLYSNARCISSTPNQWTSIKNARNQAAAMPVAQKVGRKDPLDTSFNDPTAAFKSKTTFELIRAYFVYTLCSSEYLVENNMKVKKIKFIVKILVDC